MVCTTEGRRICASKNREGSQTERSVKSSTSRPSVEDSASARDGSAAKKKSKMPDVSGHRSQQKHSSACRSSRTSLLGHGDCDQKFKFSVTRQRSRKSKDFEKMAVRATILAWLVDTGTVQENAEVYSMDETTGQMKNRGILKIDGILCFCCNKIFSVPNFHLHGGRSCKKPYKNIFISDTNVPLLSYMAEAWNEPGESESHRFNAVEARGDIYDDACMVCADGGNLMCCEKCSSTYHQVCLGMENVPEDSWYCPYCVCKFCLKPSHENDFLIICPQCDKRYHWECHRMIEQRMDLNSIPVPPFCDQSCKEVFDKLTKSMLGKQMDLGEGYSWTLLHRIDDDEEFNIYIGENEDYNYWRTMCNSKLVVARRLMEACFEPIKDRHTRVKIIPSVVYNCRSNFRRVSYGGFYSAVLEKDDEIICVASLRVHGRSLAEMPFIATHEDYRCRGMCAKLMAAIQSGLCDMRVKNLVIPSVPEKSKNWISGHGFLYSDKAKMRTRARTDMTNVIEDQIRAHSTVMFHDSVRLHKPIMPSQ
ncbi:increased DNA methylation 1-like [Andrographis paniculata]|uniref:increased DNA methylation 1-like n=1 Tax=Andrographis paniculata TaxID=175694 RepID=UPI0021E8A8DA|nr:increased DNA methylation 1-like [Andrographis paniculata]